MGASFDIRLEDYPYREHGGFLELEGLRLDGDPNHEESFWDLGYKHAMAGNVHFQVMAPGAYEPIHLTRFGGRFPAWIQAASFS